MSNYSELDLAGIRAARAELQSQEDAVSFVRRMAQGRLDIARDEQRRRTANMPTSNTATDLAGVFGQEHGGGSARPPRETNVSQPQASSWLSRSRRKRDSANRPAARTRQSLGVIPKTMIRSRACLKPHSRKRPPRSS